MVKKIELTRQYPGEGGPDNLEFSWKESKVSQRIVPPKNQIRPLLNDSLELINHLSPITWFQTNQLDEALQQEINKSNPKANSTFFKLIVLYIPPTSQTNDVHVSMSV